MSVRASVFIIPALGPTPIILPPSDTRQPARNSCQKRGILWRHTALTALSPSTIKICLTIFEWSRPTPAVRDGARHQGIPRQTSTRAFLGMICIMIFLVTAHFFHLVSWQSQAMCAPPNPKGRLRATPETSAAIKADTLGVHNPLWPHQGSEALSEPAARQMENGTLLPARLRNGGPCEQICYI